VGGRAEGIDAERRRRRFWPLWRRRIPLLGGLKIKWKRTGNLGGRACMKSRDAPQASPRM